MFQRQACPLPELQGGLPIGDLKALGPVARGQQPLVVAVNGVTDIRTLIKLKAQYGVNAIILGGAEAHLIAPEIAAAKIPVILNPLLNLPGRHARGEQGSLFVDR